MALACAGWGLNLGVAFLFNAAVGWLSELNLCQLVAVAIHVFLVFLKGSVN